MEPADTVMLLEEPVDHGAKCQDWYVLKFRRARLFSDELFRRLPPGFCMQVGVLWHTWQYIALPTPVTKADFMAGLQGDPHIHVGPTVDVLAANLAYDGAFSPSSRLANMRISPEERSKYYAQDSLHVASLRAREHKTLDHDVRQYYRMLKIESLPLSSDVLQAC